MPRCLQLSWPHIFWQIGYEAFTTDAHIAKISSAKLPLWPARGTWQAPCTHRSIKPNLSSTMQIMTNSIILHYALSPANLPNSRESGRVSRCFSWGACCLTEWCWNCNPHPPFCLPSQLWPSHLFCLFWFFPPFFVRLCLFAWPVGKNVNLIWTQINNLKQNQRSKAITAWLKNVQKLNYMWGTIWDSGKCKSKVDKKIFSYSSNELVCSGLHLK